MTSLRRIAENEGARLWLWAVAEIIATALMFLIYLSVYTIYIEFNTEFIMVISIFAIAVLVFSVCAWVYIVFAIKSAIHNCYDLTDVHFHTLDNLIGVLSILIGGLNIGYATIIMSSKHLISIVYVVCMICYTAFTIKFSCVLDELHRAASGSV